MKMSGTQGGEARPGRAAQEDQIEGRSAARRATAKGRRCTQRAPGPPEGVLPQAIASLSEAQARSLLRNLRAVAAELDISVEETSYTPLSDL